MLPAAALSEAGGPAPMLTLDESIAIALRQSVVAQSAREGVAASEARRKEALTAYGPRLSTSYQYSRLDPAPYIRQPAPIGTLTTGTRDNYTWSVDVRQPLFTGGRITADAEIGRIGLEASRQEERGTAQEIVLEVKRAYFGILKAGRLVEVAAQSVEQLTAHRDLAKQFLEVGLVPRNDYLQAEVRLANGVQQLVRARNRLEEARARFNTILRRPLDAPAEVEDLLSHRPFGRTFEDCRDQALRDRPEIRVAQLRAEQAGQGVRAAESEFYPSLHLVGSYQRYGDTADVGGSPYRDPDNWAVGATATWDVWEWGRTRYARDASASLERQARYAVENVQDQVSIEVKSAWLAVKEAEQLIGVARVSLDQAEENYRITGERYREQVARTTEVLDALALLTLARASYADALADFHLALAALERAIGTAREHAEQE